MICLDPLDAPDFVCDRCGRFLPDGQLSVAATDDALVRTRCMTETENAEALRAALCQT